MTSYIDTNIIIYQIEGTRQAQQKASAAVAQSDDQRLVTSEITLGECLLGAQKRQSAELVVKYREILSDTAIFRLVPVDRGILEAAAKLGAQYRLKLVDAIHVATAVAAGCDAFITNDKGIRAGESLRIIQLDHDDTACD